MAPSLLPFASAKVVKIFQLKDDDGQKFLFLTSFLGFVALCFFVMTCVDMVGRTVAWQWVLMACF